ncbi:MAG: extracellular solute-binding protein [Actinomycetota bacterium]|nr:extracellular solute-binding protein [Actinomycetota bacterium]
MTLRVALVGGPMYDGLYELFADEVRSGAIEVVVHADHPTLNRAVAELLAAGERLDLISTHGKYAPSQTTWLQPLDDLVPHEVLDPLAPRARDLCSFGGALLCAPRNIDVRVLWWRTDLLDAPPVSWDDVEAAGSFGFTGRESGLFGLFFELMASAGAALFDADLQPTLDGPAALAAVERLQRLAATAPDDLPSWHYDDVDEALLGGRVTMAAAWPGGYARIRRSDLYDRLAPAAYPGGRSYSGCHGWAIPTTCGDLPAAVELLTRLCSLDAGMLEGRAGGVPAHLGALDAHEPADEVDDQRWTVTRATIADAMLTYPPLVRFPEVEDAGWGALHDAIRGACTAAEAVDRMQVAAAGILAA